MSLEVVEVLISHVGFPIFVAAYLLIRQEKTLDRLRIAIDRLTAALINRG